MLERHGLQSFGAFLFSLIQTLKASAHYRQIRHR